MTTTTVRCQAKNPAICRVHGRKQPAPGTTEWILSQPDQAKRPPAPILTDPEPLTRALTSTLSWTGPTPAGWNEYVEETRNHPDMPGTPELLDVIPSPMGPLAVTWFHDSQDENDLSAPVADGMRINRVGLYSLEQNKDLGRVKIAYVDDSSTRQTFGNDELTPLRWAERYGSGFYEDVPTPEEWTGMTPEEKASTRRELWAAAMRSRRMATVHNGETIAYQNITTEHAPETDEGVVQSLKKHILPAFKKDQKEFATKFAIPFIDRSRVEPVLKGQGYGTAMYVYAARRLAQEGKVLKASGVQSVDAKKLWGRFQARFKDNISTVTVKSREGVPHISPVLDFR